MKKTAEAAVDQARNMEVSVPALEDAIRLNTKAATLATKTMSFAQLTLAADANCEPAMAAYARLLPVMNRLEEAMETIDRKAPLAEETPVLCRPERVLRVREAVFSVSETVPAAESVGRILAAATVGCPPAVPIVVCGERIDRTAVELFRYYGMETCTVVKG